MKENKVCYVVTFWLGERRFEYPEYKKDNLYFIKQQIKCLESYKQDLTKIIFIGILRFYKFIIHYCSKLSEHQVHI